MPVPGRCQVGVGFSREPDWAGAAGPRGGADGCQRCWSVLVPGMLLPGMLIPDARAVLVPVPVDVHSTGSVSDWERYRGVARDISPGGGGCWWCQEVPDWGVAAGSGPGAAEYRRYRPVGSYRSRSRCRSRCRCRWVPVPLAKG